MYLGYQQIAATAIVKTYASAGFTLPANVSPTHVELQADTQDIRYTMDNATNPTQTSGMVLAVGDPPKLFVIDDLLRIRFVRGAGADGVLNVHYVGGRAV